MKWKSTSSRDISAPYSERYVWIPDNPDLHANLRVLKLRTEDMWVVRWGATTTDRHYLPPDTPLGEVQAAAILVWRLSQ